MERKKTFYEFLAVSGVPVRILNIMKKYNDTELSTALVSIFMNGAEVYSFEELAKDNDGGIKDKFGALIVKVGDKERFVIDCKQYIILAIDKFNKEDTKTINKKKEVFTQVIENPNKRVAAQKDVEKKTYKFFRFIAKVTTNNPNEYLRIFAELLKEKGYSDQQIKDNFYSAVSRELDLKIEREDEERKNKEPQEIQKRGRKKKILNDNEIDIANAHEKEYNKLQEEIENLSREKTK